MGDGDALCGGQCVNGSGGASCCDGADMARKQDVVIVTVTRAAAG